MVADKHLTVTMYIQTLVIVLCAVSVVKACCKDDLKEIDSIYDETPCLMKGGMCTIAADCPKGRLEPQKGLCPEQQYKGVECCYGLSVKETRCDMRGGFCTERCHKRHLEPRGTNCPKNTVCCILV